ncbi:metallophosphoesterase [Aquimarina sediminis]|uniref:metallophosphoesterase n=1 Tax=Aquimarina sediminis TaxID=2070536 RepID=UPI000CA08DEC|nr:metallophosphoesterase [Aquimarina sediminis]
MIKIIHLSDIHINDDDFGYNHKRLIDSLLEDISNYIDKNSILVFSGDFLNQGGRNFTSKEHYNTILEFLNKFTFLKNKIFFVPGNHEIDRSKLDKYTDFSLKENLLNKNKDKDKRSSDLLNNFLKDFYDSSPERKIKGLESYNEFAKKFYSEYDQSQITGIDNSFVLDLDGTSIGISCLNSSWLSYDDNDEGNIAVGIKQVEHSLEFIDDSKIKVCIIHHPLSFLSREVEQSEIEKKIYKNYDIILIGHTHEQQTDYVNGLYGKYLLSIGKSLTSENSKLHAYKNGYTIIEYEHNEKIKCHFRKYDDDSSGFIPSLDNGITNGVFEVNILNEIPVNITPIETPPALNEDFENSFVLDAGAKFTNRSTKDIRLKDIYVSPFFERYDVVDQEDKSNNVTLGFIHKNIISNHFNNIILFGEENSGKTAFCKITYEKILKESDLFPVYIPGKLLKETNIERVRKLILKEVNSQYDNFTEKSSNRVYLIFDDFNDSKLSFELKKKLVNSIIDLEFKSLIIWDEYLTLSELLDVKNLDVNIFELLPFGASKRFELIKKWKDLTLNDDFVDEKDKVDNYYAAEKIIDSIIGKNLVPSLPIYILIILQSNELTSSTNLEQSTFGYYYDVLIKSALGQKVKENKEIEKLYSYLSELAYELFLNKSNHISEGGFIDLHNKFKDNYDVEISFVKTEQTLIETEILRKVNDFYKFKYTYIYFYFIAKYLADNIEEEHVMKHIKDLSSKLYQSHSANIYMFLSHHSKSKLVIDEIISVTKNLFTDSNILNFNEDINEINNLIKERSENLTLDSTDHVKNKEEELSNRDVVESSVINDDLHIETESNNEIDYISQINTSYKSIEILGHIVKNRYASLRKEEKIHIIENVYFLSIKTLSSMFNVLLEGEEHIKNEIIELIGEDTTITENEKETLAKKIMFNMLYMISYSTIKKVSSSISSRDLKNTFDNVKSKYDKNNIIKLITIANKFDYNKEFPFEETKELKNVLNNNILPFYVLRRLGYNFLKFKPLEEIEKQKISGLLDISVKSQRLIEGTSKVK